MAGNAAVNAVMPLAITHEVIVKAASRCAMVGTIAHIVPWYAALTRIVVEFIKAVVFGISACYVPMPPAVAMGVSRNAARSAAMFKAVITVVIREQTI